MLEVIRGELWKIHDSYERLEYQELISCNCHFCKGSDKPESYSYELLMHYVANHEYEIKCHRSFKQVDVRRLISDITDHTNRTYIEKYIDESSNKDPIEQFSVGSDINNSIVIIGDQNQANIELAQTAKELETVINKFAAVCDVESPVGQEVIKTAVLAEIQQKPTLKQRVGKALRASGEQALIEAVNHPAAKIAIKGIKALLEG